MLHPAKEIVDGGRQSALGSFSQRENPVHSTGFSGGVKKAGRKSQRLRIPTSGRVNHEGLVTPRLAQRRQKMKFPNTDRHCIILFVVNTMTLC